MKHLIGRPTGINFTGLFSERKALETKHTDALDNYVTEIERREILKNGIVELIAVLEGQEDDIRMEMEMDPEVIANSTDGNHPAVVMYSDQLEDNWNAVDALRVKLNDTTKEDMLLSVVEGIERQQAANKASIDKAFNEIN